jgi:hypothetical protein
MMYSVTSNTKRDAKLAGPTPTPQPRRCPCPFPFGAFFLTLHGRLQAGAPPERTSSRPSSSHTVCLPSAPHTRRGRPFAHGGGARA